MRYMDVQQAAKKWNLSDRRVRQLCSEGRIEGALKVDGSYVIPSNALKPGDARSTKHIPEAYQEIFNRIDKKKSDLKKRRPLTEGELIRLKEEFLLEFTYNSNAIEGSTLTLQETAMVLEGITIDRKPLKEHLEAVGHKEAFEYVQELVTKRTPFSERVIKEVHSLVLMDRRQDKGVYRKIPVRIMGAENEPPQPYLVPIKMEELISKYKERKQKMHIIEVVSRFHLEFESIHPFIDGNGRVGRLLLNFELMKAGYLPINVKFADRRKYYDCFKEYHTNRNIDEMVLMVANYIEEELDRYLSILS